MQMFCLDMQNHESKQEVSFKKISADNSRSFLVNLYSVCESDWYENSSVKNIFIEDSSISLK